MGFTLASYRKYNKFIHVKEELRLDLLFSICLFFCFR